MAPQTGERTRRSDRGPRLRAALPFWPVGVTVLLTAIAAVLASDLATNAAHAEAERSFERTAHEHIRAIENALDSYATLLADGAAVFDVLKIVDHEAWSQFVGAVRPTERFPGALGLAYVQRVHPDDLDAFVAWQRTDGRTDFAVRIDRPGDTASDTTADTTTPTPSHHAIITHHAPEAPNASLIGVDVSRRPVNMAVYDAATRTGTTRLSSGFQLLQSPPGELGAVLAHPVYAWRHRQAAPEDAPRAVRGWIGMPVSYRAMLDEVDASLGGQIAVTLTERSISGQRTLARDSAPADVPDLRLEHAHEIDFGGQSLIVHCQPATTDAFAPDLATARIVQLAGVLIVVLAGSVAWFAAVASIRTRTARSLLKRENADLRRVLDQHTLLAITDRAGVIVEANEGFCRVSGYRRDELVGETHRLLNSGHHPKAFWAEMWRTIANGDAWRADVCNQAKDGSHYWVDSTNVPTYDEDGAINGYISLRFDITEKKASEDENRVLLAAFERSPVATVVASLEGIVVNANPAATELSRRLGHALATDAPAFLFTAGRLEPETQQRLIATVRAGDAFAERIRVDLAPHAPRPAASRGGPSIGSAVWLDVAASPLADADGSIERMLLIERDVTAEVQRERAARMRTEAAEARARISSILADEAPLHDRVERAIATILELEQLAVHRTGGMFVLDPGADRLRRFVHVGDLHEVFPENESDVPLSDCRWGRSVQSGELLVRDECSDDASAAGDRPAHGHYIVPLLDEGTCVGALFLYTEVQPSRDPERLEMLRHIGQLLGSAVVRDRERQTAERSVALTEQIAHRLRVATTGAGVGIWEFEPGTDTLTWDDTMYRIYGLDPATVPSYETWASALLPEDRPVAEASFRAALARECDFDTQFRVQHTDGRIVHVRGTATVFYAPDGSIERVIGANWDVTDTAEALEHLRESQQVARLGSWSFDLRSGHIEWSQQLYELFDRDPADGPPIYDTATAMYDDESEERVRQAVETAAIDGTPFSIVLRTAHGHNGVRYIQSIGRARRDRAGEIVGLFGTAMDVTESVEREQRLSEITTALDAASDCVFMFEGDSLRFVYVNDGACTQVGYAADELCRMTPIDIQPDFDEATFRSMLAPLLESPSESLLFRTAHRHRDGTRIPVEISLQFVPQLGRSGRFVALVRDITQQLESERTLTEARDAAEAASRAKTEFLANTSHEIRTPMTAILGYADLLADDLIEDPEGADQAVETIRSNARHLLTIINDILDVSKIEAGHLEAETIETDPAALVDEVVRLVEPRARLKEVAVEVSYETDMPAFIRSDPTRLRQIILNLASNAIKFTDHGRVHVRVACDRSAERLRIAVEDTGVGMTPEELEIVSRFDAFSQADASTTRRFGGTGLGLRISNALAELLGGGIDIESTAGAGSTFTATVATGDLAGVTFVRPGRATNRSAGSDRLGPAGAGHGSSVPSVASDAAAADDSPADARPLVGVRILLAEDGPDNQKLIAFHLRRAGAEVTIHDHGRAAVEAIQALDAASQPHVVLMDMQMPVLDGYGATRALRDAGFTQPIVAITAHAMAGDRTRCLEAGCDDYLSKPIDRKRLVETCARWAMQTTTGRSAD